MYDLQAAESCIIQPRSKRSISTGIVLDLEKGYFGKIYGRSGLAFHHNVHTLTGIIDQGFRGELRVLLNNHSFESFHVNKYQRIAMLEICKKPDIVLIEMDKCSDLTATDRSKNGFGSTGLRRRNNI